MNWIKNHPFGIFSFFFIATVAYIWINIVSYFDLFNFCYIGIDEDVVRGSQDSIKKAIVKIRNDNPDAYKTLCQNVDTIIETFCYPSDLHVEGANIFNIPGCYLRGSKIVYLRPEQTDSASIVVERANNLMQYAQYSKEYWAKK